MPDALLPLPTRALLLVLSLACGALPVEAQTPASDLTAAPNRLTAAEISAGWELLWDGKTTTGWRSAKSDQFPATGWPIHEGVLTTRTGGGGHATPGGGDILTRKRYANFELVVDFKVTPGANSGIKIFVQPALAPTTKPGEKPAAGSPIGLEFQIIDDQLHADAKLGHDGDRTIGSLYDLIPAPKDKKIQPIGEWNRARIVSRGKHVEFWLNGAKTVEFERGSADFRQRVSASKFKNFADFGEWTNGHILLQEHGDEVSFRGIKIRELKSSN